MKPSRKTEAVSILVLTCINCGFMKVIQSLVSSFTAISNTFAFMIVLLSF